MLQLSENQSLLLKACSLPNGEDYFQRWLQQYNLDDLDYHTRALIPLLLNVVDVAHFSPSIHQKMVRYKRQTWLSNTLKFRRVKLILELFDAAEIKCCLLKGAAMMQYFYQDVSQRPERADVDLLIPLEDFSKAMGILKKNGFVLEPCFSWSAEQLEMNVPQNLKLINTLHALHYKRDRILIDLHWQISSFINGLDFKQLESTMLSQKSEKNSPGIFYLSYEMQLIHVSIHAAFNEHYSPSLTNVIDFCFLINRHPDFKKLYCLSTQLGVLGYVKSMVNACRPYIKDDIYEQYQQIFKHSNKHISVYIAKMMFSASIPIRRIGQIWCIMDNNNYYPLSVLSHIKYYFGVRSWKQFFNRMNTLFFPIRR